MNFKLIPFYTFLLTRYIILHKQTLISGLIFLFINFNISQVILAQSLGVGGGGFSKSSFAISINGKIYAWGNNDYGQLGIGNYIKSAIPLDISDNGALEGRKMLRVASGETHTLALAADGTVYAWGNNDYGQLGNGSYLSNNVPVQVTGLSSITAIAAGRFHSMAIKSDGTVYSWGGGQYGILGNGSFISSSLPVKAVNLSGIIAIAAGWNHSLALKSDGTVYAWGAGFLGQLGDGNFYHSLYGRAEPLQVPNLSNITAITSGIYHSLALKSDGSIHAWGSGFVGQLGEGKIHNGPSNALQGSAVPVKVINVPTIKAIAAGGNHSLALSADSMVYSWGLTNYVNGFRYTAVPVHVTSFSGITAIAGGGIHSLVLKSDGTINTWGFNESGQLGNGLIYENDILINYTMPMQVTGLNLNHPPLPTNCQKIPPSKVWDKTLGGIGADYLKHIDQTADGGYILGGTSNSYISVDKSENPKGITDFWIVKVNVDGIKEWDKTLGGNQYEELISIQQTTDGGYILGGRSNSDASGDKSENARGDYDYWVVKLNEDGTKEWDKTFGGSDQELLYSIKQTVDGGYILGGVSHSGAGFDKSQISNGATDYWVVKVNAAGTKEWDKSIGGNFDDYLTSIQQTHDGGYLLGGYSKSDASGYKTENTKGLSDYWVVKLNAVGTKEWDRTFGGFGNDELYSLQQTKDNGYILGGVSESIAGGDKSEFTRGRLDYWVVKVDGSGRKEWDNTIGGNEEDLLWSIQQTNDGGYILGGTSDSGAGGDKTENGKGQEDYWVVKLNASGCQEWDKTLGGSGDDAFASIIQTKEGDYILGGPSNSEISGDKTQESKGSWDYWIVKLLETVPYTCTLALTTQVTQAEPWYGMWGYFSGAGAIDLMVTGGTAPYTYKWNAGFTTQDIATAMPGQYSVTVTDANGCTANIQVYIGRKNDFLRVLSYHKNVSTPDGSDGAIDLTVIGGVVPATFRWSNGATTEDLNNLSAGTYTVIVTDAFGRQATTTVIISGPGTPLSLAISHQNVSAAGKQDGAVDLTVVGGTGPYSYRWNTGAVTGDLHYAAPGLYTVTVTDATGATATASVKVEVGVTPILMARHPGADDLLAPTMGLTVYPNPATEKATININLETAGKYTIELYNIRGAIVKTLATGQAESGKAINLDVNMAGYAEGVYLLKLQTDKGVNFQRLLIKR